MNLRDTRDSDLSTVPENSFFENSPVPSLATPKSFTLGNDQIHLSLLSLNQDFSPEEGLHRFPLNPLSPQGTGDLKPGRLGLYSQTSSRPFGVARELLTQQKVNFVDSRLRSAEHSSELDALLSLARELRVFMRRGRGCASCLPHGNSVSSVACDLLYKTTNLFFSLTLWFK